MANNSNRGGNRGGGSRSSSERSVFSWETAREKPLATAVTIGAAAAAGAFLWSRRNQISEQLSDLSEQIGEWTDGLNFGGNTEGQQFESIGASGSTGRQTSGSSTGSSGGTSGMSETGGGNASIGRRNGGGGSMGSASGRGRAQSRSTT